MGKKPRSKAVDVTKSLLQATSVSDYIVVQVSPNHSVQVAEEELSPTAGSEAAFALRREGKLDSSMKLCINWRQGSCHNHAACTFAHVNSFFNVANVATAPAASSATGAATSGRTTPPGLPSKETSGVAESGSSSWVQRLTSTSGGRSPEGRAAAAGPSRGLPAQSSWGSRPPATEAAPAKEFYDLETAMSEPRGQQKAAPPPAPRQVPPEPEAPPAPSAPEDPVFEALSGGPRAPNDSPLRWLTQQRPAETAAPVEPPAAQAEDPQLVKLRLLEELTGGPVTLSPYSAPSHPPAHNSAPFMNFSTQPSNDMQTLGHSNGGDHMGQMGHLQQQQRGMPMNTVFSTGQPQPQVQQQQQMPQQPNQQNGNQAVSLRQLMSLLTSDE